MNKISPYAWQSRTCTEENAHHEEGVATIKYGLTQGCRGFDAASRGSVGIHDERCRDRVEKEISPKEPETFDKAIIRRSNQGKKKTEESDETDDPAPEKIETTEGGKGSRTQAELNTQ